MKNLGATLNGIWWILCTGAMWNQLPEEYGKWNSVYRMFNRWSHSKFFSEILKEVSRAAQEEVKLRAIDATHCKAHQDSCRSPFDHEEEGLGKTKGGRNTKISACVTAEGNALKIEIIPGNHHESTCATSTLGDQLSGCTVLADKAYDSKAIRDFITHHDGTPNIPSRKNAKNPAAYDKTVGKQRRVVENYFCRIKRYRRVATRYEKLAVTYLSFVTLASLMDWAKN